MNKLGNELAKELSLPRATVFSIVDLLVSLHELVQNSLVMPDELASDVAEASMEKLGLAKAATETTMHL